MSQTKTLAELTINTLAGGGAACAASQCITPEYPVMHTLTGQRNSVSCSPAPPEA